MNSSFHLFALILLFLLLCLKNAIVFKLCSFVGISSLVITFSWIMTDNIMRYLVPNKPIDPNGHSVLITGCDTGFGYETANRLNQKGWHVFACVLSEASDGAKQLESMGCTVIEMDVTKDSDFCSAYDKVVEECAKRRTKLWTLVNNAGVMTCGPVEWSTMDEFDRVLRVNVYGYVRAIRQFLPLIRESSGRIVNISSCSALFTAPGVATYSMSKSAISSLTDGLRRELHNSGVKVIEVIPQAYRTQMSSEIPAIVDRVWAETRPQVKRDYGLNYYESFKQYIKFYNLQMTSSQHNQVLDPLLQSIISQRVFPKYLCCSPLNRLIIWSFNWLPVQWLDSIAPIFTLRATPDWLDSNKCDKNNSFKS